MSVDRLREAAALLRERAEKIEPSAGWSFNDGGARDDGTQPADSALIEFITMMSPPVALAVADWLDTAGVDEWAHGPHCSTPCDDCDDDPRAQHIRSALAVADAILRSGR